jgi:dodecin
LSGVCELRNLRPVASRVPDAKALGMVEKTIVLTGISANSIEDAVQLAVTRASVTITGIHRALVTNVEAEIEDRRIARWKVTVNCTFRVTESLHE